MALAAAQRLDEVAAAIGGLTSRFHPLTESELPEWRISRDDEEVTTVGLDGLEEHVLTIATEGSVMATADLDDVMHAFAASALTTLNAAQPNRYALVGIDSEPQTQGEAATALIRLRLVTRFFVQPAAPEVIVS